MIEEIFKQAQTGKLKEAAELIRKLVDQGEDLKGTHVNLAHILFLAADWSYIDRLLPRNTNTFSKSGHLKSIASRRPINDEADPVPWFTYPAIDFLDGIVSKEWVVFEWGSGNSTLWWSSRVHTIVAVEDNSNWYDEVSKKLPNNAKMLNKEGDDYCKTIAHFPENAFNVIVVDGSQRNRCLKIAIPYLKEDGILIFDNSDGKDYIESSNYLNSLDFYRIDFWGLIPSYLYKNCTTIYFKNPKILSSRKAQYNHRSSVGTSCFQANRERC